MILTATAADTLTALDCLAMPAVCLPSGEGTFIAPLDGIPYLKLAILKRSKYHFQNRFVGISQLPLATMAFLESFRKIILWLDNGVKGAESARAFARKLGEKRCHLIRLLAIVSPPQKKIFSKSHKKLSGNG